MTQDVRIRSHTRTSLELLAARAVLVVPTAATEQHGPHLPVGTDALIVEHVALRAAERAQAAGQPSLVAPLVAYGSSDHHLPFPGTLSLRASHFLEAIEDIGRSASRWGVRHLVFLNGHGGNDSLVQQAARNLVLETGLTVAAGSYWNLASASLGEVRPSGWPSIPGHAGAFETSVMLELHPELVDRAGTPEREWPSHGRATEAPKAEIMIQQPGMMASIEGFTDAPGQASAELGRRYLEAIIVTVAEFLRSFAGSAGGAGGGASRDEAAERGGR